MNRTSCTESGTGICCLKTYNKGGWSLGRQRGGGAVRTQYGIHQCGKLSELLAEVAAERGAGANTRAKEPGRGLHVNRWTAALSEAAANDKGC